MTAGTMKGLLLYLANYTPVTGPFSYSLAFQDYSLLRDFALAVLLA